MLPLWWIIGIEQFVWLPLATITLALVWLRYGPARPSPVALALLVFMLAVAASGHAVESPVRGVTYLRSLVAYTTVSLFALGLTHPRLPLSERERIVRAVAIAAVWVAVMALVAVYGVWRPNYSAPTSRLLPNTITSTDLGQRHVSRSLGGPSWLAGRQIFRPSGPFLFATGLGMATAVLLPVVMAALVTARRRLQRVAFTLGAAVVLVALITTTGRTPLAALLLGVVLAGAIRYWRPSIGVLVVGLAVVTASLVVFAQPTLVQDTLSRVLEARGSSTADRVRIYETTVAMWVDGPWLTGFGTEIDVAALPYPAGSHSYPLGVLFRFGLAGFVALTLLAALMSASAWRALRSPGLMFPLIACSWIVLAATSLTDAPDLDHLLLTLVAVPQVLLADRFVR